MANRQDIRDCKKIAVTNKELKRLNVDIDALQETRLADSGTLKDIDYTFYWEGKGSDKPREHGIGFAVRNSLLNMTEPGYERLLTLLTPNTKDEFYENVASIINSIPNKEQLVLLGDFNANHDTWPSYFGHFGVGRINENGQRLLELCIVNTCFKTKPQHKVPWRRPRSKHWHQLGLILFSPETLSQRSGTLRDTMHRTALAIFWKKTSKIHDWFDAKSTEMTPVIETKRAVVAEYKHSSSEKNLQIRRAARSKAQQTARRCANEYRTQLSEYTQTAAATGNIREHQSLEAIDCLPTMNELDAAPTVEGLGKISDSLASGKAPGSDGMPLN
ncbi:hypothetical protein NP493_238g03040 [Ridgeia piscesae]|uniref:Endonuclease/exonuclease/phosphatase domain-containing protein n=1 Tax=Ridgeia piscesae TaxID=27915 RepID=A0AAD9NZR9_RIDPI|nr:hypothetical protein NP493_238g03040 [Ridgeia piscesae]